MNSKALLTVLVMGTLVLGGCAGSMAQKPNIAPGVSLNNLDYKILGTVEGSGSVTTILCFIRMGASQFGYSAGAGGGSYGHFFYSHLYLAQAKFQRGGREWARYYSDISRRLLSMQSKDGTWMGDSVGTAYGTALAVVILGLPYRYVPIYQR